jgi:cytochrome c oxidase subunit II
MVPNRIYWDLIRESRNMRSIPLGAAVILLMALVLPFSPTGRAESKPPTITIHAKRFEFDPSEVTLKQGQTVNLLFISDDVPHGIAIEGLGIHLDFRKHHNAQVLLTPPAAGDFEGECSVFCGTGHDMMKLVIHVIP